MNLSGNLFTKFLIFLILEKANNIVVFHDDLDLNFSKIRVKTNGGHGGHNGIKDIIKFLGKDFNRIKIGIKNTLIYIENEISADKFVWEGSQAKS